MNIALAKFDCHAKNAEHLVGSNKKLGSERVKLLLELKCCITLELYF